MRAAPIRLMFVLLTSVVFASCQYPLRSVTAPQDATEDLDVDIPTGSGITPKRLACEIDFLERHIDAFGSIVPKRADVWGQARLMMHRHEFEADMVNAKSVFAETLQGSVERSDQAYLAAAFSMSAALGAAPLVPTSATGTSSFSNVITNGSENDTATKRINSLQDTIDKLVLNTSNESDTSSKLTSQLQKTVSGGMQTTYGQLALPTNPAANDLVQSSDKVIKGNPILTYNQLGYAGTGGKLHIEPTMYLNQKARFLQHLDELRRINEGDDNADAPGYALNLVRIPVSIMTGKHTQTGYGAEITVTASPRLTEDLLPTTFKNLVIRDIVDELTLPVTQILATAEVTSLRNKLSDYDQHLFKLVCLANGIKYDDSNPPTGTISVTKGMAAPFTSLEPDEIAVWAQKYAIKLPVKLEQSVVTHAPLPAPTANRPNAIALTPHRTIPNLALSAQHVDAANDNRAADEYQAASRARQDVSNLVRQTFSVSASRRRASPLPIPPSQLEFAYGDIRLGRIAITVFNNVKDHIGSSKAPFHLDVESSLQDELEAAYNFLASDQNQHLWCYCSENLTRAIRENDRLKLAEIEQQFTDALEGAYQQQLRLTSIMQSPQASLAWMVLVESALLNDRLSEDMKRLHAAKGCVCPPACGMQFFLPSPPAAARECFNDYVRCRWPLYVFAVDPVTEDQNIGDAFSMRREMQLALALAFSTGKINANTMTRYTRHYEKDMETIAVNRTMVGFSNGDNVFGWRFYPRFQTPPVQGNLETIGHDLLMGNKNDKNRDLRFRQLENGERECVALVIMPSFVPYVDLDMNGNWFSLVNPKAKELTLKETLRLKRRVHTIREATCACSAENGKYCDDGVGFLERRLEQLATRLPSQSQIVNVPYENTHGGFTMFSTGVTDLAPELYGWYGAPGLDAANPTSIFLVGNNFSVNQTRVIVGGQVLSDQLTVANVPGVGNVQAVELLSRQVMRVTIPPSVRQINNFADVHVATPYGASRELQVPMLVAAAPSSPIAYSVDPQSVPIKVSYKLQKSAGGNDLSPIFSTKTGNLKLTWSTQSGGVLTPISVVIGFNGGTVPIVCKPVTLSAVLDKDKGTSTTFAPSDEDLTNFLKDLIGQLGNLKLLTAQSQPMTLTSTSVMVTPAPVDSLKAGVGVQPVAAAGAVQIVIQFDPSN